MFATTCNVAYDRWPHRFILDSHSSIHLLSHSSIVLARFSLLLIFDILITYNPIFFIECIIGSFIPVPLENIFLKYIDFLIIFCLTLPPSLSCFYWVYSMLPFIIIMMHHFYIFSSFFFSPVTHATSLHSCWLNTIFQPVGWTGLRKVSLPELPPTLCWKLSNFWIDII